jgi:hypothetical protein
LDTVNAEHQFYLIDVMAKMLAMWRKKGDNLFTESNSVHFFINNSPMYSVYTVPNFTGIGTRDFNNMKVNLTLSPPV